MSGKFRRLMTGAAAVFLSCALAPAALPVSADTFYSEDPGADRYITGDMISSNRNTASAVDYWMDLHPDGSVYKGGGECYGYAEAARKFFGTGGRKKNINKKMTRKNLLAAVKGCPTGTHLRLKTYYGMHSVCVLKCTKKYIYVTDGNVDGRNMVRIACYYTDEFAMRAEKIVFTIKPAGMRKQKTVKTAAFRVPGATRIVWPQVKGAKKYTIYRSTSSKKGFKKIGSQNFCGFTDKKGEAGRRYYYRVAASVRGRTLRSKPVSGRYRLTAPLVTTRGCDENGGGILEWKPVKGARKYWIYNVSKNKKIASVTGTRFVVPCTDDTWEDIFGVCAVPRLSAGKSVMAEGVPEFGPGTPVLKYSDGELIWESSGVCEDYVIYRADSEEGPFQELDDCYDDGYILDEEELASVHYYRVRACLYRDGKWVYSSWSNTVRAGGGQD